MQTYHYDWLTAEQIASRTEFAKEEVIRLAKMHIACLTSNCEDRLGCPQRLLPGTPEAIARRFAATRAKLKAAKEQLDGMLKKRETDPDDFGREAYARIFPPEPAPSNEPPIPIEQFWREHDARMSRYDETNRLESGLTKEQWIAEKWAGVRQSLSRAIEAGEPGARGAMTLLRSMQS